MTLPNLSPVEVVAGASGLANENAAVAPISGASFGSGYQSPARPPIREGALEKRFVRRGERRFGPLGAARLGPDPGLRLAQQGTHLVEHVRGGRTCMLQLLDPLEPGQHRARFLHSATVARRGLRVPHGFAPGV